MDDELLLCEVEDGVMTLTLNRPDKLNAMNPALRAQWLAAMDRADGDDAVRAVIITGAGRAFCAGADISGGASGFVPPSDGPWRDGGGIMALRLFESKKPLIAAINGPAVGVGVSVTLPMDYRIASTTAKFGFVYTQRAISPEACSSWFLPRIVGVPQALDWMLSGRVFGAEEAMQAGLVKALYPPDQLLPEARSIARQIATQTAPVSAAITRRLIWDMLAVGNPHEAHRRETITVPYLTGQPDAKEGVASFLEKRPARFTGSVSKDYIDPK